MRFDFLFLYYLVAEALLPLWVQGLRYSNPNSVSNSIFRSATGEKYSPLLMSSEALSSLSTCQLDAYAKTSINKVIACKKLSEDSFQITLEDSVLYPEGGGQPCDYGSVSGFKTSRVDKCDSPELLSISANSVNIILSEELFVGAEVVCEVDWQRRYDHMQQHTSQVGGSQSVSVLIHADNALCCVSIC